MRENIHTRHIVNTIHRVEVHHAIYTSREFDAVFLWVLIQVKSYLFTLICLDNLAVFVNDREVSYWYATATLYIVVAIVRHETSVLTSDWNLTLWIALVVVLQEVKNRIQSN